MQTKASIRRNNCKCWTPYWKVRDYCFYFKYELEKDTFEAGELSCKGKKEAAFRLKCFECIGFIFFKKSERRISATNCRTCHNDNWIQPKETQRRTGRRFCIELYTRCPTLWLQDWIKIFLRTLFGIILWDAFCVFNINLLALISWSR